MTYFKTAFILVALQYVDMVDIHCNTRCKLSISFRLIDRGTFLF